MLLSSMLFLSLPVCAWVCVCCLCVCVCVLFVCVWLHTASYSLQSVCYDSLYSQTSLPLILIRKNVCVCVCVTWERPSPGTSVITCLQVKPQSDPLSPDPGPLQHIAAHCHHHLLSPAAAPEKLLNIEEASSARTRFISSFHYVKMGRKPNITTSVMSGYFSKMCFQSSLSAQPGAARKMTSFPHSSSFSSPLVQLAAAPPGGQVNSSNVFPSLVDAAVLSSRSLQFLHEQDLFMYLISSHLIISYLI